MRVTIQKSGSTCIVSIPQEILIQRNFKVGDTLDVTLNQEGNIVFSSTKPPFTLASLLTASPEDRLTPSDEDKAWLTMQPQGEEL